MILPQTRTSLLLLDLACVLPCATESLLAMGPDAAATTESLSLPRAGSTRPG